MFANAHVPLIAKAVAKVSAINWADASVCVNVMNANAYAALYVKAGMAIAYLVTAFVQKTADATANALAHAGQAKAVKIARVTMPTANAMAEAVTVTEPVPAAAATSSNQLQS